jgi:hypothetical protein
MAWVAATTWEVGAVPATLVAPPHAVACWRLVVLGAMHPCRWRSLGTPAAGMGVLGLRVLLLGGTGLQHMSSCRPQTTSAAAGLCVTPPCVRLGSLCVCVCVCVCECVCVCVCARARASVCGAVWAPPVTRTCNAWGPSGLWLLRCVRVWTHCHTRVGMWTVLRPHSVAWQQHL